MYCSKKVVWFTLMTFLVIALTGCGGANNAQKTEPTVTEPAAPAAAKLDLTLLHPASPSTVATSTEPLGEFNVGEIGVTNIVDINFVESKISDPNWVIIDGREKQDYDKGHIPGAIHFGDGIWKILKHPMDGRVVAKAKFEKIMGEMGISNDKKLIVYGTKGDYHVTLEMAPVYYGMSEWDYMNGGFEAWAAAGKKVDTKPNKLPAATFTAKVVNPNMYVSTYQMADIVAAGAPDYYLLDTRSDKEFNGIGFGGTRAGRIPGANNFPPDVNFDKETKALFSVEKLAEIYKDVPKDKTIILYCHRGCRTGFAFLALRALGYNDIRVYEDGFVVWNQWTELPLEDEHFINYRGDIQKTVDTVKEMTKK